MPVTSVETLRWTEDRLAVELLDQTRLPGEEVYVRVETAEAMAEAIRALRVRGAPAIGVAAAMGLAVEAARHAALSPASFRARIEAAESLLRRARPTAVNPGWALDRMLRVAGAGQAGAAAAGSGPARSPEAVARALADEATAILEEDRAVCQRIGEHGLEVLPPGDVGVLTHCNAGALATAGIGTALAPIYVARAAGRALRVYAGETRPLLQGSRLTVWELARGGVDATLITDSMAAHLMRQGRVDLVVVGADRVAANGDVANKIGTYGLAVLARHHGIPFYVAAPVSTIDPATPDGAAIPIEERDADEVRRGFGRLTAPPDAAVLTPAFDVTPAELVTALITDRGVLRPPLDAAIRGLHEDRSGH